MKNCLICLLTLLLIPFDGFARFDAYFSPQTHLDEILVADVRHANQSIDIAIYTFSAPDLLNELTRAMDRGVRVRLLVRKSIEKMNKDFLKPLKDRGASVRVINKINHHKFMIVDGRVLLNSSANFSQTALQRSYDENLVRCDQCAEYIRTYQEEFDFLYRHSNRIDTPNDVDEKTSLSQRPPSRKKPVALFTSRNYVPEYEPRRGQIFLREDKNDEHGAVETALIHAISQSRHEIQIATGHFRSWPLLQALRSAVQRGVRVQLVLDSQEYVSTYKQNAEDQESQACQTKKTEGQCRRFGYHLSRLAWKAGVDVRIKSYGLRWNFMRSPQMHHKYMIIDGRRVYSGSYNWSYNAEFQSTENILIATDSNLVHEFTKNFEQLLGYGSGQFSQTRDSLRAQTQQLPYPFSPVTLTYPELDELRAIACEKCPDVFCSSTNDERETGKSDDFCPIRPLQPEQGVQ